MQNRLETCKLLTWHKQNGLINLKRAKESESTVSVRAWQLLTDKMSSKEEEQEVGLVWRLVHSSWQGGRNMLIKSRRLNLKTDFSWVVKGQKTETDFLKIFFRSGENNQPRVGIALKKESFQLAVDRNRARRLTSKAFENIYDQLPANINIIAMPKSGILKVSSDEATEHLKKILVKLV